MDNASQADSRRNETNLDPLLTSSLHKGEEKDRCADSPAIWGGQIN